MKKYLLISIFVLLGLTSYLGYQNYIKYPTFEFIIYEDNTLFIDGKFHSRIEENTTLQNAPIGHYQMDSEDFYIDKPHTTVYFKYK